MHPSNAIGENSRENAKEIEYQQKRESSPSLMAQVVQRVRNKFGYGNSRSSEIDQQARIQHGEDEKEGLQNEGYKFSNDKISKQSHPTVVEANDWSVMSVGEQKIYQFQLITAEEADYIVQCAEQRAEERGGWTTNRHKHHPTTDLEIEDISKTNPSFQQFYRQLLDRIFDLIVFKFPFLQKQNLYTRDAFVVKYEMEGQRSLGLHQDGSDVTFNVALTERFVDYNGGGTYFDALRSVLHCSKGNMVMHSGNLKHAGVEITNGKRYILVGFVASRNITQK